MFTKKTYVKNVRRAVGMFLFLALFISTPSLSCAQEVEADLEAELATESSTPPKLEQSATETPVVDTNDAAQNSLSVEQIADPESDTPSVPNYTGDGQITVERPKDVTLPYKERRNNWGVLFAINYEQFNPENYNSLILNQDYKTISGDKSIPLIGAEFGVKYNFLLGSVSALVGYSQGEIDNKSTGLDQITTSISKADINIAIDGVMNEPYIVPYAQFGMHSINWSEEGTVGAVTSEESFTTDWNFHYKVGFSFQLNWIEKAIDPSSQEDSVRSGLENTYLDVFYTSYAQPAQVAEVNGAEGEADLQSSQIGAGLKLEF
jgi:hypothetical protein